VAGAAVAAPSAHATVPLVEGDDFGLTLGGYARFFSAVQVTAWDSAGLLDRRTGTTANVTRGEWRADLGRRVTVDLHQRVFFRSTTASSAGLGTSGFGVGVTEPPPRNVDLSTAFVDDDDLTIEHDIDRLALRIWADRFDLVLGRQAITWGTSQVFPVADVWTAYSPLELDNTEKRGVDAARATVPLGRSELDVVVADRGDAEDLSGGVRYVMYLDRSDAWMGAAKLWDELAVMGGFSRDLSTWTLRGDVVWPVWSLDRDEVLWPRAALGVDWLSPDVILSFEVHANGEGAGPDDGYIAHATTDPQLQRGEVSFLGRYYAAAIGSFELTELVRFTVSGFANLQDPSGAIAPSLVYQVGEATDLSIGAFSPIGEAPNLTPVPSLPSEFGAGSHMLYAQAVAYW